MRAGRVLYRATGLSRPMIRRRRAGVLSALQRAPRRLRSFLGALAQETRLLRRGLLRALERPIAGSAERAILLLGRRKGGAGNNARGQADRTQQQRLLIEQAAEARAG